MKNFFLVFIALTSIHSLSSQDTSRDSLENIFIEWRSFEKPPKYRGAPDYRKKTFDSRMIEFEQLRKRLNEVDKASLDTESQVDWTLIWAEMNGFEFNYNILKPWERDPAFYKSLWMNRSDVPAHEGPTHHMVVEVWQYDFPLSRQQSKNLTNELSIIPAFNQQAKTNLTGNARDLWIAGIRDIDTQVINLELLKNFPGVKEHKDLILIIDESISSTKSLSKWLKDESKNKTGPSGIGKDNYTWYQKNVHLVPLSWDDEVMLLKRELARAWSSLKLEEHKNRNLPKLTSASNQEEYMKKAKDASKDLIEFLDKQQVINVKDYYKDALDERLGKFVPEDTRNFFWITAHLDPKPLYSHFFHWFELAEMDLNPHKNIIRKDAVLYNIFDSRNEGVATSVEEMFMQAGLYESNPRS